MEMKDRMSERTGHKIESIEVVNLDGGKSQVSVSFEFDGTTKRIAVELPTHATDKETSEAVEFSLTHWIENIVQGVE